MEKWRSSSICRFAIIMIAICGLLGQTSVSSALAAAHSFDGVTCAQAGQQPDTPAGKHQTHGDCCILAGALCGWFVLAYAAVALYPARAVSTLAFGAQTYPADRKPEQFYLTARGPPRAL